MYEYKYLTVKSKMWGGEFNFDKIQTSLNGLAKEGWRVSQTTPGTVAGFIFHRKALFFLLERKI